MEPTIFGLPQSAVVNQLQNLALIVLTFFASRAHLSTDMVGEISGIVGLVVTAAANAFAVRPGNGNGSSPSASASLANGPVART